MSFWLGKSKFELFLQAIPWLYRVVFSISVFALLGGAWYWRGYFPLQQKSMQTSLTIQSLTQRNAYLATIIQQRPLLEQRRVELDQKLSTLAAASKLEDQDMIERILMVLKKHDVSCKELKPLPVKDGAYWQKHSFDLVFKGNFKNVKSCMRDLFAGSKYVSCNKLLLVRLKHHKVKGEMKVTFITFGEYEDKQKDVVV